MSTYDTYMAGLSPYLWWKMNEVSGTTATDYGSGGNNGTYSGGYTLEETPPGGMPSGDYAVAFDGSSGGLVTSYDPDPSGDFTFVCWWKGLSNYWAPALFSTNDVYNYNKGIIVINGVLGGYPTMDVFAEIGGGAQSVSLTPPDDSNWHMLAVTYTGSHLVVSIDDGAESGSTACSGSFTAGGAGGLYVAKPHGYDSYCQSYVCQMAYWPSLLTGTELAELYTLGTVGGGPTATPTWNPKQKWNPAQSIENALAAWRQP